MKRSIGMILLSAALAGSAGIATAQGMHEQRPFSKPTERVEARLAYVKTALKITPAQEGQWGAYADSVRRDAAAREAKMREMHDRMAQAPKDAQGRPQRPHPSAVERLERQQKFLAEASARLNARAAAVRPLYDALSAEQKKVADVVLVQQGRGRHGGRGMHMHRGMA